MNGLAGLPLVAIIQAFSTILIGIIIGFAFGPKITAVGIALMPLLIIAGYGSLRLVLLKDQANKAAHEESARMACEAAGSIRTVASLTREADCLKIYSDLLKAPLRRAARTNLGSTAFFAISQSMAFFAIALVFWYGARLVSTLEYTINQFFVGLMAVTFGAIQAGRSVVVDIYVRCVLTLMPVRLASSQMSQLHKLQLQRLSISLILDPL